MECKYIIYIKAQQSGYCITSLASEKKQYLSYNLLNIFILIKIREIIIFSNSNDRHSVDKRKSNFCYILLLNIHSKLYSVKTIEIRVLVNKKTVFL